MSVVLRCPSCSAKLRLDEAPPLGTMIDCPKCSTSFPVRQTTTEEKPKLPDEFKPPKGAKPAKKQKVVETEDREFMNEYALLGMVGGAMLALVLLLGTIHFFLSRTAKVEDMVACVPESYPIVRGINVEQLRKMPGYQGQIDTVYTKDIQQGWSVLAKGLGVNEAKLSYIVIGHSLGVSGQSNELYIFRTKDSFDKGKVDKIEGIRAGKDPTNPNRTFYAFEGTHELPFLKGTAVECPTKNLVVVTRFDLYGKAASEASALAANKPLDGTQKKVGTVGKLAMKGHFWTIARPVGDGKLQFAELAALVGQDKEMTKLAKTTENAKAIGLWTIFGSSGLRCAIGLECGSDAEAKELVKSMQEGPLSKGDESEAPSFMRSYLPLVNMKRAWGEFLQAMSFNQQGTAAFIKTKLDNEECRSILFTIFTGAFPMPKEAVVAKP